MIGLINSRTRKIRLEIVDNRTSQIIKPIIKRLVPKGNTITTDAANCYNFLNQNESRYIHHVHNHGHGNFGAGLDSTSHIEQL